MLWGGWGARPPRVALRKESVDRNVHGVNAAMVAAVSLSARRAWIEMLATSAFVACAACRSPQGERG